MGAQVVRLPVGNQAGPAEASTCQEAPVVPCRRCGREHVHVSPVAWGLLLRDAKPKPPPAYLGVLWMLAMRLDLRTGCGFASTRDLAELAGTSTDTVERATAWARDRLFLHRAARGARVKDGVVAASEWELTDPTQTAGSAGLDTRSQRAGSAGRGRSQRAGSAGKAPSQAGESAGKAAKPADSPTQTRSSGTQVSTNPSTPEADASGVEPHGGKSGRPDPKGHRIPDGFAGQLRADPVQVDWFRRECPDVDGRVEMDKFVDYWRAKAGAAARHVDWTATWRNWMRRAQQDITNRGGGRGGSPSTTAAAYEDY